VYPSQSSVDNSSDARMVGFRLIFRMYEYQNGKDIVVDITLRGGIKNEVSIKTSKSIDNKGTFKLTETPLIISGNGTFKSIEDDVCVVENLDDTPTVVRIFSNVPKGHDDNLSFFVTNNNCVNTTDAHFYISDIHAYYGNSTTPEMQYTQATTTPVYRNDLLIPAVDDKTDALGNPLQYKGSVYPFFPKLRKSNCLYFDGVDDYLSIPSLVGDETVTNGGTAIPTISAGRIDFTEGTVYNLQISNGMHFPCCEGEGFVVYDVNGGGENAVLQGGVLWSRQDDYSYNFDNGFNASPYYFGGGDITPIGDYTIGSNESWEIRLSMLLQTTKSTGMFIATDVFGNSDSLTLYINTSQLKIFIKGNTYVVSGITQFNKSKMDFVYGYDSSSGKMYLSINDNELLSENVVAGSQDSIVDGTLYYKSNRYNIGGTFIYSAKFTIGGNVVLDTTDPNSPIKIEDHEPTIKLPALADDSGNDVFGDPLTNLPIHGHNGAETAFYTRNVSESGNANFLTHELLDSIHFDEINYSTLPYLSDDHMYGRHINDKSADRLLGFSGKLEPDDQAIVEAYIKDDGTPIPDGYDHRLIFVVRVDHDNGVIKLPTVSGVTYDCAVVWGDRTEAMTFTSDDEANTSHMYAKKGEYVVTVVINDGYFKGDVTGDGNIYYIHDWNGYINPTTTTLVDANKEMGQLRRIPITPIQKMT